MTQEDADAKSADYVGLGWSPLRTDGDLAFISPCREWIHSYNRETSGLFSFPVTLAKRLGMYKDAEQEEVLPKEVQM